MINKGTRFLFILYFIPPAPGTAPKRNFRIANYLAGKAERSFLFTVQYPGKPVPEIKGIDVFPVKARDYRTLLRKRTEDGYLPEQKKKAAWKQWGIKLINTFPFNMWIGEGGMFYFNSILKKGNQLIHDEKLTHLYSSFRPFADHYIAYRLKRKNPGLIWIADFRDLIIDPHYKHNLFTKKQDSFFKRIFRTADVLTTVSEGLAKRLRDYNGSVLVVRNGIEGDILEPQPNPSTHFTITYTGSLFLNTRNPQPVFKALRALINKGKIDINDIRIHYAGKDSFYWQKMASDYHFEKLLEDHGLVTYEEAKLLQQQSCINLLLTISSPELTGVLTGKMIEYFQSGSPVIAIVSGQNDDELNQIVDDLEIGKSFSDQPDDEVNIEDFIHKEYEFWKKTNCNRKPVNLAVLKNNYSMNHTMKPLIDFIEHA